MDPLAPEDDFEFERTFNEPLDKSIVHHAVVMPPHLQAAIAELLGQEVVCNRPLDFYRL